MAKETKKENTEKRLKTLLKSRLGAKDVIKKQTIVVEIPESSKHIILNEKNKFFTGEFNKERKALFLS